MMRRVLLVCVIALALPVCASDFTSLDALTQGELHGIAQDLGAAFSYKGVTPATPLGAAGFDVGVEVTDTRLESANAFAAAGAGGHSHLTVPKLHVYKGLFGGFDIGGFFAGAPEVSGTLFGADLRYAIVDDTLTTPAVAVRLSGTRASGLGDLSFTTGALDAMLSKRFTALTPYVGAGVVRIHARARGTALAEERFDKGRAFAGLNVNLAVLNFAFEAEKMGGNTSLSAKVGWRF